jgi:hypothetical protein
MNWVLDQPFAKYEPLSSVFKEEHAYKLKILRIAQYASSLLCPF